MVWEAYKRVKANQGAAGVDEESLADFEEHLTDNLYKLWNRLASGSYFPPPVRTVMIPKRDGGQRALGIPTVSDRIAQTVVAMVLEPVLEPHFHPDSYGYRPGKSAIQALGVADSGAGAMTGSWIWTSRGSLTTLIIRCCYGHFGSTRPVHGSSCM